MSRLVIRQLLEVTSFVLTWATRSRWRTWWQGWNYLWVLLYSQPSQATRRKSEVLAPSGTVRMISLAPLFPLPLICTPWTRRRWHRPVVLGKQLQPTSYGYKM